MPFPTQNALPFTQGGVQSLNPGQTGVYGIYNSTTWIYVGKADDLRARLLQHLSNNEILKHKPTYFVTEVTKDIDNREKQLIVELQPVANKKVG